MPSFWETTLWVIWWAQGHRSNRWRVFLTRKNVSNKTYSPYCSNRLSSHSPLCWKGQLFCNFKTGMTQEHVCRQQFQLQNEAKKGWHLFLSSSAHNQNFTSAFNLTPLNQRGRLCDLNWPPDQHNVIQSNHMTHCISLTVSTQITTCQPYQRNYSHFLEWINEMYSCVSDIQ